MKITTIVIPVTKLQLDKLKEKEQIYFSETPYDYAFIGMRCAAGAYERDTLRIISLNKCYKLKTSLLIKLQIWFLS